MLPRCSMGLHGMVGLADSEPDYFVPVGDLAHSVLQQFSRWTPE